MSQDSRALVLAAVDVVELISQTVALKRRGRKYLGLCPFHTEKTPSFTVDPVKQAFYCFGCKASGSVFDFVMKRDRVEFREALEILGEAVATRGSYTPGDAIAHVHVALHAHEDAIRELERACAERSSSLHFVGIAPEFVPLRSDERFLSIVRTIGLEPEKVFAANVAR